VARNYRYDRKELDIVAWDNNELVIVEVRTRASEYHEHPRDSITPAKMRAVAYAAEAYIMEN
jgi:putative endonuclease